MGGWVAGAIKNKAISASNEVEVEVEAELGNNKQGLNLVKLSSSWAWTLLELSLAKFLVKF